jgi:hypothetical protein
VIVDIKPVFAAYFARNRGPVPADSAQRKAPNYGVRASLADNTIDLGLTFQAGSAYCCSESGCHLNLYDGRRWGWLRQELAALGIVSPLPIVLRLEVVIEEGSLFFDFSRPDPFQRGWYAFAPASARVYNVLRQEAEKSGT